MNLYKGYIKTNGKKSAETLKNRDNFKSLEEVKDSNSYAGILNSNVILVDIDDYDQSEILMNIVEDLQLRCRVYETSKGKHFVFLNSHIDKCPTHSKLACGLEADIKVGLKTAYQVLKLEGKEREIIYDIFDDEEYEEIPKWLFPVNSKVDFINLDEGDGRNQKLFSYILTLESCNFTKEESRKTIRLMNKYVIKKPLPDSEIETILRDEAFEKTVFFNDKTFLFDKFATYLKNNHHIVKINNQLHIYNDGIYVNGTRFIESAMIKNIPNLNRAKRAEVLSYIDILIDETTPMSPANYIAFKNGIYDIVENSFNEFSPDKITVNKINWNYNPAAYSKICDNALNKLACGDKQIRMLLEEVIGYTFYRRNELRKAFILIGDKANGKSTYLDMIKTLLGDENTSALDLNELGDRFKTAELFGKLANIGDDIGDEFIPNPAIFKKLTSGDRLNAERKGQDPFDFNSYAKLLFSANNIPRIKDKSGAVIDRLIIIPFNATFSSDDEDYDPYIKYKLRTNEALEYLINIGLEGLKRVIKNQKFTICEKVQKQIEEYEEHNNPILLFFKEIEDESQFINEPTKNIYQKYQEFCIVNSFQPMSNIEFSKQVRKRFNLDIVDKKIDGKKYRIFIKRERRNES